jgi:hypothetical protein
VGGFEAGFGRESSGKIRASKKEAPDQCGGSGADYCGHQKTVGGVSREEAGGGEEKVCSVNRCSFWTELLHEC